MPQLGEHSGKMHKLRPFFAACVVNIVPMMLGIWSIFFGAAVPTLMCNPPVYDSRKRFYAEAAIWMVWLPLVGEVTGALFWGQLAERAGRKASGYLLVVSFPLCWGAVVYTQSTSVAMAARIVLGSSGTGALVLTSLYANEIAEDSNRGCLSSLTLLFFNFGIVATHFSESNDTLFTVTFIYFSVTVLYVVLLYFLPESPVYLWTKQRRRGAEESLLWLRNGDVDRVKEELLNIAKSIELSSDTKPISYRSLYDSREAIMGTVISLGLFAFQQLCGIHFILMSMQDILEHSFGDLLSIERAFVKIAVTQLISSWLLSSFVERFGRRTLLIASFSGMVLALFIIGLFFFVGPNSGVLPTWLLFFAICIYMAFYCLGAGPMAYVVTSEVLRPDIRPRGLSIVISWGTILAFALTKISMYVVYHVNLLPMLGFYACCCALAVAFTITLVPETRGKSQNEIRRLLSGEILQEEESLGEEIRL